MEHDASFGSWLTQRRKTLGLARAELARRVSCATITLRKIEEDARRPSLQLAALLAEHLGIPASDRATFIRVARGELPVDQLTTRHTDLTQTPSAATLRVAQIQLPLHQLIGRERERTELTALLRRPDVRLITLTGPGGTGKTSLALTVASELAPAYSDGVWFVDLAPISDIARVGPAIAQAIGLPESVQSDARDEASTWARLGRWIGAWRALLVLDNLEQVIDVAPRLAGLLRTAPGITLLVTSRLILRLGQEHEYPVAPLPLPPPAASAAEIGASPAVRLFVERAHAVRPTFALTEDTAAAVSAICSTLDGLPLALELAAARVRLFTPKELAVRLAHDSGLSLLTHGAHDAPARQQTIRSTLEWSYSLLGAAEQRLLARLSVFVGGWTLALAEAVCGDDDGVINGLGLLVEHSLVQRRVGGEGMPFRLLATVRAFAHERLASDALAEIRDRHLAAYVVLAEEAEPQTRGAAQLERLARLDSAYEDLRAALVWALDEGENAPERRTLGLRLAGALWYYWFIRGRFREASRWLDHPAANDERLPTTLRAHMLLSHWTITSDSGGQTEPYSSGTRGEALAARTQEDTLIARSLALSGDSSKLQRAAAHAQAVQDPWWRAWLAYWLTTNATSTQTARHMLLVTVRQTGDEVLLERALSHLAFEALKEGNVAGAQQLAQEELDLAQRLSFTFGIASALFVLTRAQQLDGDLTAARSGNDLRYAAERRMDNRHGSTATLLDGIRLAIGQSDYLWATERAAQLERSVLATWSTLEIYALVMSAWLALEQGRSEEASATAHLARERCGEVMDHLDFDTRHSRIVMRLGATWLLGTIDAAAGRLDEAAARFEFAADQLLPKGAADSRTTCAFLLLYFCGDSAVTALSGLGRIAASHPSPVIARTWLDGQLTALQAHTGIWSSALARAAWGRAYLGWGEYAAAASHLTNDLRYYQRAEARRGIAETLEGLGMCAAQARPERAALLWGFASALRTQIGAPMWPVDRPIYERHVAQAHAALGRQVFEAAWAAGEALPLDQAVADALALP